MFCSVEVSSNLNVLLVGFRKLNSATNFPFFPATSNQLLFHVLTLTNLLLSNNSGTILVEQSLSEETHIYRSYELRLLLGLSNSCDTKDSTVSTESFCQAHLCFRPLFADADAFALLITSHVSDTISVGANSVFLLACSFLTRSSRFTR